MCGASDRLLFCSRLTVQLFRFFFEGVCIAADMSRAHQLRMWRTAGFISVCYFGVIATIRLLFGAVQVCLSEYTGGGGLPSAVLVLGGEREREEYAAKRLRATPIDTYVSSGCLALEDPVFDGVRDHVIIDRRAVDTVTNYSTMVDVFRRRKFRHVAVVTCPFHLRRAKLLGKVMLGSRGIYTSYEVASCLSSRDPEPIEKSLRDLSRAIFWVAFQVDGQWLSTWIQRIRGTLSTDFDPS